MLLITYFVIVPPTVTLVTKMQVTALTENNVTLTVNITMASPPVNPVNITWVLTTSKQSQSIDLAGDKYIFSMDRQTLTITKIVHSDEGRYTITGKNPAGMDSVFIDLTVQGMYFIVNEYNY